jgi:hypothetical protein
LLDGSENRKDHPRLEDIAIPVLFFPIGLLKFFGRIGAGDGLAVFSAVCLTVVCLLAFFAALFHARLRVRLVLFGMCVAILGMGIFGWHWEVRDLESRKSGMGNLLLGTPEAD